MLSEFFYRIIIVEKEIKKKVILSSHFSPRYTESFKETSNELLTELWAIFYITVNKIELIGKAKG